MAKRDPIESEDPNDRRHGAAAKGEAEIPAEHGDAPRWLVPTDPPPV